MSVRVFYLVLLVVATGSPVRADEITKQERQRAVSIFDQGKRYYELAEFEQALSRFQEAYEIWPAPVLLFNIAQTHRLLGDCAKAAFSYRSFLDAAPDSTNRADVAIRIGEMDACVERAKQEAAPPPPVPVAPMREQRDSLLALNLTIPREPNPVGFWIGGIGAGLGLGAAMVFHLRAQTYQSDIDELAEMNCAGDCVRGLRADRDAARTGRTISLVGAGAMVVIGAVVYMVGRPKQVAPVEPRLVLDAGSDHVGLTVGASF